MTRGHDHSPPCRSPRLTAAFLLGALVASSGCSTDAGSTGPDDGPGDGSAAADAGPLPRDGGSDRRDGSAPAPETDGDTDPPEPWDAGRGVEDAGPPPLPEDLGPGLHWVRTHPMFISGLTPSMGAPSAAVADAYFDDFGANAVHLWQRGLPTVMDGWRAARPGTRFVSWVRDNGTSLTNHEVLGGYGPDVEGRIGYQVGDEPRNMEDLLAIEEGVRAVRERDPNALVIVNFGVADDGAGPGGGGMLDAMLEYTVENELADVLSHDNYSRGRSGYEWLEHFRELGLEHGLPYWRYIKSYRADADEELQTESDMRWHAFVGLVYGYTGHSWFVYQIGSEHDPLPTLFERGGDWEAPRTPRFGWAAQVNEEMAELGRVITQLESTAVCHVVQEEASRPDGTRDCRPGSDDPYLDAVNVLDGVEVSLIGMVQEASLGFFRDTRGDRYVMVQNPNRDGASFPLNSTERATVELRFDFADAPAGVDRDRVRVLDPETGAASSVALETVDGDRRRLELEIDAGDVVLMKYATGRGFARR